MDGKKTKMHERWKIAPAAACLIFCCIYIGISIAVCACDIYDFLQAECMYEFRFFFVFLRAEVHEKTTISRRDDDNNKSKKRRKKTRTHWFMLFYTIRWRLLLYSWSRYTLVAGKQYRENAVLKKNREEYTRK